MSRVGGVPFACSLNNSPFSIAADSTVNVTLSGFTNEQRASGSPGGSGRTIKTPKLGLVTGIKIEIDGGLGDHERINELSNLLDNFNFTLDYPDGTTYGGEVQIVDEFNLDISDASVEISVSGNIRKL